MANYLYRHKIMTDLTNCYGFDATQEAADKTDFETNHKSSCYEVDALELLDTAFVVDKTFDEFDALIDGTNIVWGDVKYETSPNSYSLYLLSENPL